MPQCLFDLDLHEQWVSFDRVQMRFRKRGLAEVCFYVGG
jgi:hypothetical protein